MCFPCTAGCVLEGCVHWECVCVHPWAVLCLLNLIMAFGISEGRLHLGTSQPLGSSEGMWLQHCCFDFCCECFWQLKSGTQEMF